MTLQLLRFGLVTDGPQFGLLRSDAAPICLTLELPYKDNKPEISCFPAGEYICHRSFDRRTSGGMLIPLTYEIANVPNRRGILFHVGNFLRDTEGCVLCGLGLNFQGEQPMLSDSAKGFNRFISQVKNMESFTLKVSHG